MRAVRLLEIGGTPLVEEVDPPRCVNPVTVTLAALNPVDVSTATGRFYGGRPETPYIVGSEAIGRTPEGRRVWMRGQAMLAELVDPPAWTFAVADGVSDEIALGCGIAGLTAWLALSWRTPVEPGDTVLVLGASGTLGAVAVQAAKLLGAEQVIGAARHPERVPACADAVFDLRGDGDLPAASLILDALWGEPLERAVASARSGARVVHLGQSAGPAATLLSAWVRGKTLELRGHALAAVPAEVAERGFAELCGHAAAGRVQIETERFALERFEEAWERQASGSPGAKLLIELG